MKSKEASFGNVRAAVARARDGGATRLKGNVDMSVFEAVAFARALLQDGGARVRLHVDEPWLLVEPYEPSN